MQMNILMKMNLEIQNINDYSLHWNNSSPSLGRRNGMLVSDFILHMVMLEIYVNVGPPPPAHTHIRQ